MAATLQALTFDWYGTLAHHRHKGRRILFSEYLAAHGLQSAPWDRKVLYDVFDFYGDSYKPESSDEEKQMFWTQFTKRLFDRSRVSGSTANQSEIHSTAIRDIFGPGCFQLHADVEPVLSVLRRNGLQLAVISNWHRGLDFFCREMNLSGLLDTVISSADIGVEKPDVRIFEEAARRLGVERDRIAHVGDVPDNDFAGAIDAGLRAILIDRANAHSGHRHRINNLYELEGQLRSLE